MRALAVPICLAPICLALIPAVRAQDMLVDGFENPRFAETDCNITRESIQDPVQQALFKPAGYREYSIDWHVLFPPDRQYPYSYGDKIAVGSKTFHPQAQFKVMGIYLSVPFTADDDFHVISHRPATSTLTYPLDPNYRWEAADSVYITISPCRGDFRTIAVSRSDPDDETFTKGCRKKFRQSEDLYYGEPTTSCPIYPGRRYFINIVFEDASDDHLDASTSSCSTEYYSDGVSPKPQDHVCDAGLQHD